MRSAVASSGLVHQVQTIGIMTHDVGVAITWVAYSSDFDRPRSAQRAGVDAGYDIDVIRVGDNNHHISVFHIDLAQNVGSGAKAAHGEDI